MRIAKLSIMSQICKSSLQIRLVTKQNVVVSEIIDFEHSSRIVLIDICNYLSFTCFTCINVESLRVSYTNDFVLGSLYQNFVLSTLRLWFRTLPHKEVCKSCSNDKSTTNDKSRTDSAAGGRIIPCISR